LTGVAFGTPGQHFRKVADLTFELGEARGLGLRFESRFAR
jgi:hypothetical protein